MSWRRDDIMVLIEIGRTEESDFKVQLESKKTDLLKMFAAGYTISDILKWLVTWSIYASASALLEFKRTYRYEIEALEKMYKIGITELKKSKSRIPYLPLVESQLGELFNIPNTDIVFNARNKETFFQICKILRDHAIDFDLIVEDKNKYIIRINAEEV